jgi:hypothetical protein
MDRKLNFENKAKTKRLKANGMETKYIKQSENKPWKTNMEQKL